MILIPAINLQDGKCVCLRKDSFGEITIYGNSVEIAKKWKALGAKKIHLVDLDGARKGNIANFKTVETIINEVDISLELGGGIRDMKTIAHYFNIGVDRIILGTMAIENMALVACSAAVYGERIIVGIDALNGIARINCRLEDTKKEAIQLGLEMKELGIERIIYTDISKMDTLAGPNLEETKNFAKATGLKVTISGGMAALKDVKNVCKLEVFGIDEVILGRAIYEGCIDFSKAQVIVGEKHSII